ncbi:hypothetical protein Taro_029921 [Colocasia esculenta]|uniref:Uncharacterized protein n=1 Tax=Colocasia esculenta TaxID=4460 RepID=A0A843VSL1_COLES|nr:hypothetical protein [Colocasia esculenta]
MGDLVADMPALPQIYIHPSEMPTYLIQRFPRKSAIPEDSRPHLKVGSNVPHQALAARQTPLQFLSARLRTRMRPTLLPKFSEESTRLTKVVSSGAASHVGQARLKKGFIGLVVSAQSGEKRLSGHLGRSRPMLL